VRVSVYPSIVARQRLRKHVPELLGISFSMPSVSYQRKVGNRFFTELLVKLYNHI
jgi:hypothetical protein